MDDRVMSRSLRLLGAGVVVALVGGFGVAGAVESIAESESVASHESGGPVSRDVTAPSPVTGLGFEVLDGGDVRLTWDAATDEGANASGMSGYLIHRDWVFIRWVPANTLNFTDTNLAPGWYRYEVRAVDRANNFSSPAVLKGVVNHAPDTTPPPVPEAVSGTVDPPTGRVRIEWMPVADVGTSGSPAVGLSGYLIHRNDDDHYLGWVPAGTTVFEETVQLGATPTYLVRSIDRAGNYGQPLSITTAADDEPTVDEPAATFPITDLRAVKFEQDASSQWFSVKWDRHGDSDPNKPVTVSLSTDHPAMGDQRVFTVEEHVGAMTPAIPLGAVVTYQVSVYYDGVKYPWGDLVLDATRPYERPTDFERQVVPVRDLRATRVAPDKFELTWSLDAAVDPDLVRGFEVRVPGASNGNGQYLSETRSVLLTVPTGSIVQARVTVFHLWDEDGQSAEVELDTSTPFRP